ncbi:secondary carrier transporter [Lithospermum erythrorhizon]|uniref:Copper transport protein n=1 Tax=Lithospermum erythrorhizon TaxID=34254 RepID=A0AAV3NXV5_LITER
MEDMGGMNMTTSPSSAASGGAGGGGVMMHMTFFWGGNTEILFNGWPGYDNLGMYIFALVIVFVIAFCVEGLSHYKFIKEEKSNNVVAGLLQSIIYGFRVGLGYLVMLAVMSFNGGVFIVAIGGHTLGFMVFGSRIFKKSTLPTLGKSFDSIPTNC